MNIKTVSIALMALMFSSMALAHPGHVHEVGAFAAFVHAIAHDGLWLGLFGVVGAIIGYRLAK